MINIKGGVELEHLEIKYPLCLAELSSYPKLLSARADKIQANTESLFLSELDDDCDFRVKGALSSSG